MVDFVGKSYVGAGGWCMQDSRPLVVDHGCLVSGMVCTGVGTQMRISPSADHGTSLRTSQHTWKDGASQQLMRTRS